MTPVESSARMIIASKAGSISVYPCFLTLPESEETPDKKRSVVAVQEGLLDRNAIVVVFERGYRTIESESEKSTVFSFIHDNFSAPKLLAGEEMSYEEAMLLFHVNRSFIAQHGELNALDLSVIRSHQETLAYAERQEDVPMVGDIIEGAYYDGAHPFKHGCVVTPCGWEENDGKVHFCAEPYTPWLSSANDGTPIVNPSGGPFFSVAKEHFELIGEEARLFCDWGHAGPCASGSINFPVTVRRWRLKESARI